MNHHSTRQLFLSSVAAVAGFSLFAETWTFQPNEKSDGYHWNNSNNWVNAAGEIGLPAEGDSLELLVAADAMHCADLRVSAKSLHFGPNAANCAFVRGIPS